MSDTRLRPAIAGGRPAKTTPYGTTVRYGDEELDQLREALAQGTLFYTQGRKVHELEAAFARANGSSHAVACSSGTAAIHAALIAIGLSPGDEVIVPPITDMGTVAPVLWQGAIPVFADVDPRSYVLDPAAVAAAMTDRTRAVIAVHLWGNACDLDALGRLCAERNVTLVEDCAQAFGCTYRGRPIGTVGPVGCFSFNEFKHISCGDGGIVLSDDEEFIHAARLATDKCYDRTRAALDRDPRFLANNYRMTELQGAVAVAQLAKLHDIVRRRRDWATGLKERLAGIDGLLPPEPTAGCDPSWWFFMLRVRPEAAGIDAGALAEALSAEGIPASAHYIGRCIYEYPVFTDHSAFARGGHPYSARRYGHGLCPVAESVLDECLVVPVREGYTRADLDETVEGFSKVIEWSHRPG